MVEMDREFMGECTCLRCSRPEVEVKVEVLRL